MNRPALSVVVPCYNEAACLELLHARAWVKLARTMHHYRRFAPRSTMGEMLQELQRAAS